jgi:hypothetical protein
MIFSLEFISGLMFGVEVAFKNEFTKGAIVIDLGIFRFVAERI